MLAPVHAVADVTMGTRRSGGAVGAAIRAVGHGSTGLLCHDAPVQKRGAPVRDPGVEDIAGPASASVEPDELGWPFNRRRRRTFWHPERSFPLVRRVSSIGTRRLDDFGIIPDLVAAVLCLVPMILDIAPRSNLRFMVFLSCGWAIFKAVALGHRYLTPSGIFFLSSGVFIGLAAYYLLAAGTVNDWESLNTGANIAFLSTLGISVFATVFRAGWKVSWPESGELPRVGPGNAPEFFLPKAFLLIALSQIPFLKAGFLAVTTGAGLAGVMMAVLYTSNRRLRIRWAGDFVIVLVAAAAPLLWMRFEFTGSGRLTLAGLGIASLMVWNFSRPRPLHKIVVFLAIPGFLLFAGSDRLGSNERVSGEAVIASGDGLESMYSPLDTFVELTRKTDQTEGESTGPQWGKTFYAASVIPVPRSIWPNKPIGLGADLTRMLRGRMLRLKMIAPEHSMAALAQGEWYVNFRWPGVVAMTLPLGWFLARLDRWHANLTRTQLRAPSNWWSLAMLACVCNSLGDLMWVGSFTFMARGGMAVLAVGIVWLVSTNRRKWSREPFDIKSAPILGRGDTYRATNAGKGTQR